MSRRHFFQIFFILIALPLTACGERADPQNRTLANSADSDLLTEEQQEMIRQLESLGYLAAADDPPEQRDTNPARIYDEGKLAKGINFVLSSHGREAYLMDSDGKIIHRWSHHALRPEKKRRTKKILKTWYIRKAHLLPSGEILAILGFPHDQPTPKDFRRIGMVKLDRDSNTVWEYMGRAHHGVDVEEDGTILVLTNEAHINPFIHNSNPVLEDFVVSIDQDGSEIRSVSVLECLKNANATELIERMRALAEDGNGDILHTNSLEIIGDRLAERLPGAEPNNVLISMREIDAIAVLNLERQVAVWTATGIFRAQHHATVLENGNILLFDNQGPGEDFSAVREFEPETMTEVWSFVGSLSQPFHSATVGATYRMPNGNTLIVEGKKGRAFEVTPEHEMVWDYLNPHRLHDDRIARIWDLQRLDSDFPIQWLEPAADPTESLGIGAENEAEVPTSRNTAAAE
jgi:hypothetical protein